MHNTEDTKYLKEPQRNRLLALSCQHFFLGDSEFFVAFLSVLCVRFQKNRVEATTVASTREVVSSVGERIRPQLELHGLARCALAAFEVPGRAGRVG